MISKLRAMQVRQSIREEGPEHHQVKEGTPTMGGILIVSSFVLTTLLWADLQNPYIWTVLVATVGFASVGLIDDLLIVRRQSNLGLTVRQKLLLQVLVAIAAGLMARSAATPAPHAGALAVPFLKDVLLPLGIVYIPFVILVLLSSSNAVNLTDGLDGLAVGSVAIAAATYTVFVYVAGHAKIAEYLRIVPVSGAGEVAIFTHGRCRLARSRRRHRHRRGGGQAGAAVGPGRWALRARGAVGRHPGPVLQAARHPGVPHGAAAPPL
jgi:phospho-N-acetylmuramoyl-pentapeptide-transferase